MTASAVITAEEAVSRIRSGDTVMVGGFGLVGAPLTLIDALVDQSEATDLTIVSNNIGEPGRGTRARAESLIPLCKVGFMERPERMVLMILGTLTDRMAPILWVIAFFSNLTVVHRIAYTWKETSKLKPLASSQ